MLSQSKTDHVSRTVSSRTLDGRRLTADITLSLNRALSQSDAEALGAEAAAVVDAILSGQIVQGQAPLTASELEASFLSQAKGIGKVARLRVTSLRLAIPVAQTPGAPRPAPSAPPVRNSAAPVSASHSATRAPLTTPTAPPARARITPTGAGSSVPPASAPATRTAAASSSVPPASGPAARPTPATPAPATTASHGNGSVAPGVVPSSPISSAPSASGIEADGEALRAPLRNGAATAVITVLAALTRTSTDALSLLEGAPPARDLCREVCACFAASIYHSTLAGGQPRRVAAGRVEAACRRAFTDGGPTATEIGFYIATDAPVAELSSRLAALLGLEREVSVIRTALERCYMTIAATLTLPARSTIAP